MPKHINFFSTSLSSNVNAGDTTSPLNSVPALDPPFYLTFGAGDVGTPEVVRVTSKTSTNVNHTALTYAHTTAETIVNDIVAEEVEELYNAASGGWQGSNAQTFVSNDGSTALVTEAGDQRGVYSKGMRHRCQQSQALTAYWSMDSASTDAIGGFNGTDTAMSYTAGKFSNAATFNGTTSKIVIADNASLKPTGEFTIGKWFKTSNTGAIKGLFQSWSANTNKAGIQFFVDASNHLAANVGNNTGTTLGSNYTQLSGTTTVTDGAFHYAEMCFRNNYLQLYLDGKLESSGYCLTPAYAATNYVRVGVQCDAGTDASFMNGQIDDLFLINGYALDDATIKAQYDAGTAQGAGAITITKHGIISADPTYGAGVTTLTIWGGTDHSIQNATISNPYYSTAKYPYGFDVSPQKWTVEVTNNTNATKNAPSISTWYNLGSLNIVVPIGVWKIIYSAFSESDSTSASIIISSVTLSSTNNSETNNNFTCLVQVFSGSSTRAVANLYKKNIVSCITKTTMYLNMSSSTATITDLNFRGDQAATIIRATSALL